ncbi:MAG: sigma-54-dependent Fis family transcriptional regulator [Candidatus Brocadiaceae bacterium]|nr:sigma-54-dependent Fis family transcriptional regulator [Candidatus Brocadiaceae bacterium]
MSAKGTVLIVDDKDSMLKMLSTMLGDEWDVETFRSASVALERARRDPVDLILTDIRMPDMDGMRLLQTIKREAPNTEVILMTAYATVSQAVDAVKAGAYNYLTKPFEPEELKIALEKALERKQLREETEILKEQVELRYGFGSIIGDSPAMRHVFELARKAADSDTTVLLMGESGTGKERFARAIHLASSRRNRRFVAINCGAMPKDLIESELFGHVRGAFSGATKDKRGLFMEAHGGTLLLDEISELVPDLQVKINRALQEREIRRVGDTADLPVDVRVIACTNRDLQAAMEAGEFREDLFYRLNVFPLELPPLRRRREDIPALVNHFLRVFAAEHAPEYEIDPDALDLLANYRWPGNVRELQNAVQRAVVLCEDRRITRSLFPFLDLAPGDSSMEIPTVAALSYRDAMDRASASFQRQYLVEVLKRAGGNVTRAAEHAGIERESFHRLLRKCGVQADDVRRDLSGN